MKTIDVGQLAKNREQATIELIDVRTPVEFREVHAEGAKNVPLNSTAFNQWSEQHKNSAADSIYVICKGGNRSAQACKSLVAAGVSNVVSVEGGTTAWQQAGLPVVRGKKAMSLERQVRILAGFLALLGAVLGYFVHPSFVGISGFIGAGLMFAGITDTCGMGMMLAKMPWNHINNKGSCSVS
ncbi:Inner membrane protein YgaP [Rubripirellula obstinata]|uniref:Inner membrane protein YgaP n=1 Tax=Rubripirellula obstinata TaxID=406547 RepID=A0A5B1CPC1_9BACT|nr:rhodanese-like domain-containing protein [Rubripirellula obstinata]KAA1262212.1 Inner membrane protein YgaP [Rubripirellula obstinata]